MATDPSSIIASLLQGGASIGQSVQQGFTQGLQDQSDQQANQLGALKLQQAVQTQQLAQQQAVAKQAAKAAYDANPSPENLNKLIEAAPDEADALQKGYQMMDAPRQQSLKTLFGQIYSSAGNQSAAALVSAVTPIIAAEKAQGVDTTDAQTMLDNLQSGDPDKVASAITGAKAFSQMHLSALDPKFAESLGIGGDSNKPYTLDAGQERFDADNNLVARGGPKVSEPHYEKVDVLDKYGTKVGERVIQLGGDQTGGAGTGGPPRPNGASPLPVSSTPGVRYTGGWTPRQANGGDNSDAAVDHKIAGAASYLGVSPTADVSSMSPMKIAQAMTLSEGGAGSIADRNNNPANIRNADGSYKVFPSKQAGLAAAASLVAHKLRNGQTTVQSMIEGLPIGGSTETTAASSIPSGGKVLYDSTSGRPADNLDPTASVKAGDESTIPADIRSTVKAIVSGQMAQPSSFALTKPYWQNVMSVAAAFDPTFDSSTQPQRVAAAKAFTGNGKAAQALASIDRLSYHLNDLYRDSQALTGVNLEPFSGLVNEGAQSFQKAGVARYTATLPFIAGELQKLTKNGQANEGESKMIMANLAPTQPSGARLAAMQQLAELTQGQFKPIRDQWSAAFTDGRPMPMNVSPEANAILDAINGDKGPVAIDPHTGRLAVPPAAAPHQTPGVASPTRFARNPQTGQRIGLVNGQWVAVQ